MPWSPTPPTGDLRDLQVALWHLRQALGDTSDPPRRTDPELLGSLTVDAGVLAAGDPYNGAVYYRPWATAARLISFEEYEVTDGLRSRLDTKIAALRDQQRLTDATYGFTVKQIAGDADFAISWLP